MLKSGDFFSLIDEKNVVSFRFAFTFIMKLYIVHSEMSSATASQRKKGAKAEFISHSPTSLHHADGNHKPNSSQNKRILWIELFMTKLYTGASHKI